MATEKPSKDDLRAVVWLQRLNAQYASIVRWVALGAFVYGTTQGRVDIMAASAGLGVFPNVVGKPGP